MDSDQISLSIQHIQRGIQDIFNAQLQIAEQRIYGGTKRLELISRRTGHLREALSAARHSVGHHGEGVMARIQMENARKRLGEVMSEEMIGSLEADGLSGLRKLQVVS